jgi:DNA repair protein RadC
MEMYLAEVSKRYVSERQRVRSPKDVLDLVGPLSALADREFFRVILLNTKNEVLGVPLISVGSLNASIVHPREILKPAILASAASIILTHNHPTGDPAPSREDVEFTRRFAKCCELIGIALLDHVITGGRDSCASLKESGVF